MEKLKPTDYRPESAGNAQLTSNSSFKLLNFHNVYRKSGLSADLQIEKLRGDKTRKKT